MTESPDRIRVAVVCVQNAGRSQMAYAFAQREVTQRALEHEIEPTTGGTRLADHVHAEVLRTMYAVGIDLSDRTPREITFEEIQASDCDVTMGCSYDDLCPACWAGENRDWGLDDPDGKSAAEVALRKAACEQGPNPCRCRFRLVREYPQNAHAWSVHSTAYVE